MFIPCTNCGSRLAFEFITTTRFFSVLQGCTYYASASATPSELVFPPKQGLLCNTLWPVGTFSIINALWDKFDHCYPHALWLFSSSTICAVSFRSFVLMSFAYSAPCSFFLPSPHAPWLYLHSLFPGTFFLLFPHELLGPFSQVDISLSMHLYSTEIYICESLIVRIHISFMRTK